MGIEDASRAGAVSMATVWDLDWVALDTTRDGNVGGPVWKLLHRDTRHERSDSYNSCATGLA